MFPRFLIVSSTVYQSMSFSIQPYSPSGSSSNDKTIVFFGDRKNAIREATEEEEWVGNDTIFRSTILLHTILLSGPAQDAIQTATGDRELPHARTPEDQRAPSEERQVRKACTVDEDAEMLDVEAIETHVPTATNENTKMLDVEAIETRFQEVEMPDAANVIGTKMWRRRGK